MFYERNETRTVVLVRKFYCRYASKNRVVSVPG